MINRISKKLIHEKGFNKALLNIWFQGVETKPSQMTC